MDEREVLWLNCWFVGVNHGKKLSVEIERHGGEVKVRVRAVNLNPACYCGFSGVISDNPRNPSLQPSWGFPAWLMFPHKPRTETIKDCHLCVPYHLSRWLPYKPPPTGSLQKIIS